MRDLRVEELSSVYGAGGRGKKCKPPKNKCGSGSKGRGGSGSGRGGSGSGGKNRCGKGGSS